MPHRKSRAAAQAFVKYALQIGAIELLPEGRRLKSERISPYFFNSGLFNTGESLTRLAEAYAAEIKRSFQPEVIFGPAYKGIPIAAAVAQAIGGDMGYAFNRKEAKDHGEGGVLVGAPINGKKVVIVDDVMTTGDTSGEAVELVRGYGGIPIGYTIAFDRQERGVDTELSAVQAFEEKFGIPVAAAGKLDDLIEILHGKQMFTRVLAYYERYGARK